MKKSGKLIASLLFMCLMLNMVYIEAQSSSLTIYADLRVVDDKFVADVGDKIVFDASFTTGPWQNLIFLFHDGSPPLITSQTIVSHAFPLEGKYLVTLMAVGVGGISSQAEVEITIENSPPSITSISLPSEAVEDELVTLNVAEIRDTPRDLERLQYNWIFGDGTAESGSVVPDPSDQEFWLNWNPDSGIIQNGAEIQHAWQYAGTYTVMVQIIDDQGAIAYESAQITIHNTPPLAEFTIDTEQLPNGTYIAYEDQLLEFDAAASNDTESDYEDLRYYWDFGDGTVGRGRAFQHSYPQSGTYKVTLLVMDNDGASSTCEKTINILNSAPTVDINETEVVIQEGQTYTFAALSEDTSTDFQRLQYAWSFENTGWRASHVWTDDWNGNISVQVSDPEGATALDTIPVTIVNVPPMASISQAFIEANLTLRMAGTPGNTLELRVYQDDGLILAVNQTRDPGCPDFQAQTIPVLFDLRHDYRIEVSFLGVPHEATPAWLIFSFNDLSTYTLFHNFKACHEITWLWTVEPEIYMFDWPVTFNGTIFEPSSDTVTAEVRYNGELILTTTHLDDGTWPVELPFTVTLKPTLVRSGPPGRLELIAYDDDEGTSSTTAILFNDNGFLRVTGLSPLVELNIPTYIMEDQSVRFESSILDNAPLENLSYFWNFGDGTFSQEAAPQHIFSNSGTYLAQLTVINPQARATTRGVILEVMNFNPTIDVQGILEGAEDAKLTFTARVHESPSDKADLRYFWDFGDGFLGTGSETFHSYARSGEYSLRLLVIDDNGAKGICTVSVNIIDEPPIVDGPFGFITTEGNTLIAKVPVFDSTIDEPHLKYIWEYDSVISTSRILTITRDSGTYSANVTISDHDTLHHKTYEITLTFLNEPPVVVASSLLLYGAPTTLNLKAFALDTLDDIPTLTYEWSINNHELSDGTGHFSTIPVEFAVTRTYYGHVAVTDDSGYKVYSNFTVVVVIDSDGDGLSDELEAIYGTSTETADTDGDYLPDKYELEESGTNPLVWDSDGDGLCDGLDATPEVMTGEALLGTDPRNPDTDGDNLTDGEKVFGWEITVYGWIDGYSATPTIYTVHSDPLKIDTDEDGLSDWLEKELGFDPEKVDTDGDGISDFNETGRGVTFDTDGDGLSDAEELQVGGFEDLGEFFLTGGQWFNADLITGNINYTHGNPVIYWGGQTLTSTFLGKVLEEPKTVAFEGEFSNITAENTRLTFSFYLTANKAQEEILPEYRKSGFFQLWNYQAQQWYNLQEYPASTTEAALEFSTAPNNYSQWVQNGRIQFRIEAGYKVTIFSLGIFQKFSFTSEIRIMKAAVRQFQVSYETISDPTNPDTDGDGLNDWEEVYPGTDGYITNPRCNDTDHDGLLDSAESITLHEEYGRRERMTRVRYSGQWVKVLQWYRLGQYAVPLIYDPSTQQEFSFNALFNSGRAKNATIFVGFSSQEELTINLIKIEIAGITVVEEINPTLEEPEGGMEGTYFFKGYDITQATTIFSGQYRLIIDAEPENPDDFSPLDEYSILLEEFKAEVVLPLDPMLSDYDYDGILDGDELNASVSGWITNPRRWDSDGDSWSDKAEILMYQTNPLSWDTDGDGFGDPYDRDPLHDLMIKVTVLEGHDHAPVWTPSLAVVLKVEDTAIVTKEEVASKDPWKDWWMWVEVPRTAVFNYAYYFDIDDDQPAVSIGVELWWMWAWDSQLLAMSYTYAVGTSTDPKRTPVIKLENAGEYWVKIQVETVALKRVNTLAVYSEGTFFNGHYPSLERFVMLQLGVNAAGGPFRKGINVILVPVSIFTRTQLHSKLETGDDIPELGESSTSGKAADFYGLDPEAETVSRWVEGLIEKGLKEGDYVTLSEALAILDYVLKNETGDVVFAYYRCDEVGEVERLGLAQGVLDFVAEDAQAIENGPLGRTPRGFLEALGGLLLGIVTFFILAALSPLLLLVALTAALLYVGIVLLGPLFAAVALAAIKVIIIVFIFIMFALSLLDMLVSFTLMAILIGILAEVSSQECEIGFFYIDFNLWGISGRIESNIEWTYNSFLGIDIPILKTQFFLMNQSLIALSEGMGTPSFSIDHNTLIPLEIETEAANSSISSTSQESTNSPKLTKPTLTSIEGGLDPKTGDLTTTFTFTTNYTHPLGLAPLDGPYVKIENTDFKMENKYNDYEYSDGVIYEVSLSGEAILNEISKSGVLYYHYWVEDENHVMAKDPPAAPTERYGMFVSELSETLIVNSIAEGLNWIGAAMLIAASLFLANHLAMDAPQTKWMPIVGFFVLLAVLIISGVSYSFVDQSDAAPYKVLGLAMGCFTMFALLAFARYSKLFDGRVMVKFAKASFEMIFGVVGTLAGIMGGLFAVSPYHIDSIIEGIPVFITAGIWSIIVAGRIFGKGHTKNTSGKRYLFLSMWMLLIFGIIFLTVFILKTKVNL
ncbi:MAG: PKD domain-containing protein [Candidatus Helarchaeota archaeon]